MPRPPCERGCGDGVVRAGTTARSEKQNTMQTALSFPSTLSSVPALRKPTVLRVVHSIHRDTAQRAYDQRRTRLPKELYRHQLSAWERDYLNWYHGDPLKRSFSMARKRSQDNRAEVFASARCGCFHCGSTYAARAVDQWYSSRHEATALCPECGIDAVLGDASGYPLTEAFLGGMRLRWYGEA